MAVRMVAVGQIIPVADFLIQLDEREQGAVLLCVNMAKERGELSELRINGYRYAIGAKVVIPLGRVAAKESS